MNSVLPVPEVFGVGGGIAEIVVDEHGGLAGEFKTLAAFVTRDEVVQANHVGSGAVEFLAIFGAGAARKLLLFAANFPAHGKFEILVTARANEHGFPDFFFLGVKGALVHDQLPALPSGG